MGIQATTRETEIAKAISDGYERWLNLVIRNLKYCGEKCLANARNKAGYKTQTGNLISSTGYVVAVDGRVVGDGGFSLTKTGEAGVLAGRGLAMEIVRKHAKSVILVFVAGMEYASYVQDRGKNVTHSAEILAERIVPKMLGKIKWKWI